MAIQDSDRCPSYPIDLKIELKTRVLRANEMLDVLDAWWIGLEDAVFGTIWDELERASQEFFVEVSTAFLRGTLGDTLEILAQKLFDKLDEIRTGKRLCERKEDLGQLIRAIVLQHRQGARRLRVGYLRDKNRS